jgi:hypothetical protein
MKCQSGGWILKLLLQVIILERDLKDWFHRSMLVWMFKDGKHGSIYEPMVA